MDYFFVLEAKATINGHVWNAVELAYNQCDLATRLGPTPQTQGCDVIYEINISGKMRVGWVLDINWMWEAETVLWVDWTEWIMKSNYHFM